jgi:hypothetical protein
MKKSISILFLSLTFSAAASTTFLCVSGFGMDADPIQANDQAINQANENLNASCTEGRLVNAHTTVSCYRSGGYTSCTAQATAKCEN